MRHDPNWYPRADDECASRAEVISAWLGFLCVGGCVALLLVLSGGW